MGRVDLKSLSPHPGVTWLKLYTARINIDGRKVSKGAKKEREAMISIP